MEPIRIFYVPMKMRSFLRTLDLRRAVVVLSIVAMGTGTPAADAPAMVSIRPFLFETRAHGEVEAGRGTLVVPEDRRRPDSRSIELAFVRLSARTERPGPPIVYLAGGPGSSGVRAGRGQRFRLFDALRESGPVILFDQRGTGWSTRIDPEDCDAAAIYPLDRPLRLEPYLELVEETARECAALWKEKGVELDAYTTEDSVADLEALRTSLGAERLDLLAISYGTHLAMAYLRMHPDRVRRVVLAGAEGPDHTIKLPAQFDAQLDSVQSLLDTDPEAGPLELRRLIRRVLEALERRPVTVRIVNVEGPDSETRLVIGRRDVAAVTISMLSDPRTAVQIPALYRKLEAGDFTDVAGPAQGLREIGGLEAMPEAMDAASGISARRRLRLEQEEKTLLLGSGLLQANLATIRGLGVRDLGDAFRGPLVCDVPTLFISGGLDGRTPPSNAEELMEGFSQAEHLVVQNGGHGDDLLIGTPALERRIVDHFLGREPRDDPIRLPPPRPGAARVRMRLGPAEASRYVGEYERREREIWRILHRQTVETLDPSGQVRFSNAVLQIRWAGNGFPLHPVTDSLFYIDFPWFIDDDFRFEIDETGRVTHLTFEDTGGRQVRMEKVH